MNITDFEHTKKFPFLITDTNTNEVRLRELDWLMPMVGNWGQNLEFGVFNGETINHMAKLRPDLKFTGFDSFEGLPEDMDTGEKIVPATAFDREGKPPEVEDNVTLVQGWFDVTLPEWISKKVPAITIVPAFSKTSRNVAAGQDISFLNLDADIYSSTIVVLKQLDNLIVPGTIIRFDELSCWRYVFNEASPKNVQRVYYTNWKAHEWKAMTEWLENYERKVVPICRNWHQSATVMVTQ